MAITALPTPPSTNDPATFATKADALLAALPAFVTEANATAAAMNLNSTTDTSASSVAIGTGAKSFTVSTGKSFQPGMYLVLADTAAPSTNSMFGQITSYDVATGALVMNILAVVGSGTKTAWTISQSSVGAVGALTGITSINGVPVGVPTLHVRDQKASGTDGGASSVGDNTRTLNNVVVNTITGASLASNRVTLPAGDYELVASAPAYFSDRSRLRIENHTDSTVITAGASIFANSTLNMQMIAHAGLCRLNLVATKEIKLIQYFATANASGLGLTAGDGQPEVYAELFIRKVA